MYVAEFGVKADDGVGPFTARNIYAGVKGDFGTLIAGNVDTPLKSSQGAFDEFNDLAADITKILPGETRAANAVAYSTPKFADAVTVTVAIVPAEGSDIAGMSPTRWAMALPAGATSCRPATTARSHPRRIRGLPQSRSAPARAQKIDAGPQAGPRKVMPTTSPRAAHRLAVTCAQPWRGGDGKARIRDEELKRIGSCTILRNEKRSVVKSERRYKMGLVERLR